MQLGYLYIGIIMLCRVVQNICGKTTANVQPASTRGKFTYITYTKFLACLPGLVILIVALAGGKQFTVSSPWEIVIPAISGAALASNTFLSFAALKRSSIAINSMFGTAGLLVPCIAGIFMFGEPMSVWQWLGIGLFMVAAYLLICSSGNNRARVDFFTIVLLCLQLLSNGATMLCQKAYTYYFPSADVSFFSFLTFAIPMVACAIIAITLVIVQRKPRSLMSEGTVPAAETASGAHSETRVFESTSHSGEVEISADGQSAAPVRRSFLGFITERIKANRKLLFFGALSAFAVFVVNQLATLATNYISSVILFVFINGGNTIIAAIVGAVMFREKPGIKGILGIILGVTALIIINTF